MQRLAKALILVAAILGLTLSATAAKAKPGPTRSFVFKGKVEAVKVVVDKQTADSVTAKVKLLREGKVIAESGPIVLKQVANNKENWVGEFSLQATTQENAAVKVVAAAVASFKDTKKNLTGDKQIKTGRDEAVQVGTVRLTLAKQAKGK